LAAPKVMRLRHSYVLKVSQATSIQYLRLMRPDNPTHVTDVSERSIAVRFTRAGDGMLRITLPWNPNLAPPGYYMLFAVNNRGIPSTAFWVQVPRLHG
jgi:hypothetical protein